MQGGKEMRMVPAAMRDVALFEPVSSRPLDAASQFINASVLLLTLLTRKETVTVPTADGMRGG